MPTTWHIALSEIEIVELEQRTRETLKNDDDGMKIKFCIIKTQESLIFRNF